MSVEAGGTGGANVELSEAENEAVELQAVHRGTYYQQVPSQSKSPSQRKATLKQEPKLKVQKPKLKPAPEPQWKVT